MSEYKKYFEAYCKEHDLELRLSSEMPVGYETANGTFDVSSRTVFINAEKLNKEPEYSKLFYLFHELRHASQYLEPGRFNETKHSVHYNVRRDVLQVGRKSLFEVQIRRWRRIFQQFVP